jgi:hypothetical protein
VSDVSYVPHTTPVPDREPPTSQVENLTLHIARALERARNALLERMLSAGLSPQGGWRIKEELRHSLDGTEWILSPIHMREMPPELEERVRIDADGRLIADRAS